MNAQQLENEQERLNCLYALGLLEMPSNGYFDRIVRMAQWHFQPILTVLSYMGPTSCVFKSSTGLLAGHCQEIPREESFCAYALLQDEKPLIIEDMRKDPRFMNNPLVFSPPFFRSYLGQPIEGPGGYRLGTLAILDITPRTYTDTDLKLLDNMTKLIEEEIFMLAHQKGII